MAISAKTRKLLWGRAANRCAYCKHELAIDATDKDEEAVIGDECHIIARHGGSRSDVTKTPEELDHYDNLILLCKIHHKMVDDQPQTYSVEVLHKMKADHEKWVKSSLRTTEEQRGLQLVKLPKVTDAKEIVSIVSTAHSYWSDYETPENEAELSLITEFFGEFEGISTLSDQFEYLAEARFRVKQQLEALNSAGFYVYGGLTRGKLTLKNGEKMDWSLGFVVLKRFDVPNITIGYHPSIQF
jgi:hypothetical protein